MTDRIQALTVALDRDYRDDDVEAIINAVCMVKGVRGVTTSIVQAGDYTARARLLGKFMALLLEKLADPLDDLSID